MLTHWGRVKHICVGKLIIIGSDNGLSLGRRQAIIWTNAWLLLIQTLGTNFSEILGKIHTLSFKKKHLKLLSAKWRQIFLGLNVLRFNWSTYLQYAMWYQRLAELSQPIQHWLCPFWPSDTALHNRSPRLPRWLHLRTAGLHPYRFWSHCTVCRKETFFMINIHTKCELSVTSVLEKKSSKMFMETVYV